MYLGTSAARGGSTYLLLRPRGWKKSNDKLKKGTSWACSLIGKEQHDMAKICEEWKEGASKEL